LFDYGLGIGRNKYTKKTVSNINHRPLTGVNRSLAQHPTIHQIKIWKPTVQEVVDKRQKNVSMKAGNEEKKGNYEGYSTNIQTSTQPTTLSAKIPQSQGNDTTEVIKST